MWTLTGGDHGEAAVLDLGKLHASAAGTLAEAEGIEHEVTRGASRAVHGLEEGGEGDELEETDPEEHLVEGAVGASGSEFCHRRGWAQGVSCVPASVSLACSISICGASRVVHKSDTRHKTPHNSLTFLCGVPESSTSKTCRKAGMAWLSVPRHLTRPSGCRSGQQQRWHRGRRSSWHRR